MNDIFSRGDPFIHRADEAAQQLANQRGWSPYSWHGGKIEITKNLKNLKLRFLRTN